MSLGYFNEKENVRKRQQHKRRAERITKENAVERLLERFLEVKVKQNLRPKSLNQFILMFNSIKAFHNEKSTKAFYLSDITTNFISDWVGWLKNEYVRYDGHAYMPKTSHTVGLSDETIATRIKRLKTFINWWLK
ncbi:phage integrase SAM-like domain-containing protein [Bacillus cereus group sp. BfR-BA-01403]|uniref:phage integrase SAM-like domain-containing protein n=1 Tax=Bacillus cereus group sp. BfR-BA-01403 TaxID=2920336 RepID=UPI001F5914B8|nr:phage integrase SAM-like domain-containing protein [Bacillus cereus group sp. BfR-BA-01403]